MEQGLIDMSWVKKTGDDLTVDRVTTHKSTLKVRAIQPLVR